MESTKALEGLRILDVSGPASAYTGRLFAGMGAEVILIEPPEGAAHRRQSPFIGNIPGIERSLTHQYLNAGKRGITLDLDTVDGREIFRKLAKTASAVIESEPVGKMKERGLDYDSLKSINPALVYTSITPFGSDGPYKDYAATDLTLLALGGLLCLGGYAEAEPTRAYGDQALLNGSQFGAIGTMLAIIDAEASGQGQYCDVSIQECVTMSMETAIQFYDLEGYVRRRGGRQNAAGNGVYQCKDGEIVLSAGAFSPRWGALMEWMEKDGIGRAEELSEPQWQDRDWVASPEAIKKFSEIAGPWLLSKTKHELYEGGKSRSIPLVPISSPADIPESEQMKFRGFLETLPHASMPEVKMTMPGGPFKFSETPWKIEKAAPTLGSDTSAVLAEVGLSADDLARLASGGVI